MTKRKYNLKEASQRANTILKQNVQRHERAASINKLRENIKRDVNNRNMQHELGRLYSASLRHNGLDVPGLNRLNELKLKVINK